jgi:DNA-binding response OmpR family regulator
MPDPATVVIFNTSPDTTDLLRRALEQAGLTVYSGFTFDIRDGRLDIEAFMRQHRPNAIVYDIAPPYDANWNLFQNLRAAPAMEGIPIVLTSTNVRYVEKLAGGDERIYEVIGKPLDLDVIVRAAKEAVRARPTR